MTVPKPISSAGAKQAAKTEGAPAPTHEAKKPQDNTAARQAPRETRAAVDNAFGDVPQAPADDAKAPDARKQPPTDAADNGGKSTAAPGDARDPKTAQDASGDVAKDADGTPVKTPDNRSVVRDKNGNLVPVDTNGKPVTDPKGNPYAVDQSGRYLETDDGKYGVYDKNGNRVAADPRTGTVATDGSGNPLALDPDGRYVMTEDRNYVVHDKANGDNLVAIDSKTGDAITDGRNNPLAIDEYGGYLRTPQGATVVYAKINGKSLPVATDENGDFLVIGGNPAAIGKDGDYLKTPDGYHVVYDRKGMLIPVDNDGTAVTNQNGYTPALTGEGKYVPGAVYDKSSGFRVVLNRDGNVIRNEHGMPEAIDDDGKPIYNDAGQNAYYDARGVPVFYQGKGKYGTGIYKDARTGEPQARTSNGAWFRYDEAANDFARDANGNILPPLYDPVNDDPARPPVRPNEDSATTLANLPQGAERGDPMAIKDELFDENGNLDADRMVEAAKRYDPRDIYDALVNSSRHGGWDNFKATLPEGVTLLHPNEEQSRLLIAGLIAWQNANGKYNPLRQGRVPVTVFVTGGDQRIGGLAYYDNDQALINLNRPDGIHAHTIFHELNHLRTSKEFMDIYPSDSEALEVVTEYLASDWTGNDLDSGYEQRLHPQFKSLDDAVNKMGDGDRNKGLDMLKRAYFAGDLRALEQLRKFFPA